MRNPFPPKAEDGRVLIGEYASEPGKPFGAFRVCSPHSGTLVILVSNGSKDVPWEHVSVSLRNRPPNWEEMCFVKNLFWADDEWVVQFHPAKSQYINLHAHCLHMWRPVDGNFPKPPLIAV